METKQVAWQDNSGDEITLQADSWVGTQEVTVRTTENFGSSRSLNIVFYSVADATKSATLKVNQAAATASANPMSLAFTNNGLAAKTVTISTNISTSAKITVKLQGTDAAQFTVSAVSALSNGKATFTVAPKTVNPTASQRTCSAVITVGRLSPISISITQAADSVQSVTYSNYRIQSPVFKYNSAVIGSSTEILAKAGTLTVQGTAVRDKTTTYASGESDTVTENVPAGTLLYLSYSLKGDGKVRSDDSDKSATATAVASGVDFSIPSLQTRLFTAGAGEIYFVISDATGASLPLSATKTGFTVQENEVSKDYTELTGHISATEWGADTDYATFWATGNYVERYTSGATGASGSGSLPWDRVDIQVDWVSFREENSTLVYANNPGAERSTTITGYIGSWSYPVVVRQAAGSVKGICYLRFPTDVSMGSIPQWQITVRTSAGGQIWSGTSPETGQTGGPYTIKLPDEAIAAINSDTSGEITFSAVYYSSSVYYSGKPTGTELTELREGGTIYVDMSRI